MSRKKKEESEEKKEDKNQTVLTQIEDYVKTSSYLGTRAVTPTMKKYVYRRRADGLAILNTLLVDKKLKDAIDFVVKFKPHEWILVCKREAGWRAAKIFSEITGVRVFTKKYPAGILTNPSLPNFIETKMVFVCDPWTDRNALNDALKIKVPIVGICNTNNHTTGIDFVIIGNNHSNKSLGLFFWLITREYARAHNIDKEIPSLEYFAGEPLVLEEPKKKKKSKEKVIEEEKLEERFKKMLDENVEAEEGV
ncbi:MAG: 30S ribosomal protein S2 [Candidatus Pacearchaeota archaeon]